MVTRKVNKDDFVDRLSHFIISHNSEIGMRHGLTEDQVSFIMEQNIKSNKQLCEHIYDFLRLEGYIEN
jgi:hypothetical protein